MTYPNWEKMYAILCGRISEALDVLPPFPENMEAYEILEKAVRETEAIYCADSLRKKWPREPQALKAFLKAAMMELLDEREAAELADKLAADYLRDDGDIIADV